VRWAESANHHGASRNPAGRLARKKSRRAIFGCRLNSRACRQGALVANFALLESSKSYPPKPMEAGLASFTPALLAKAFRGEW